MTSPTYARGVLCTHDRYDTLEEIVGGAFDDHNTLYVRCDGCKGLYVVTQWKTRGEDWSPMPSQDVARFGLQPLSTMPTCPTCDTPMTDGEERGYFSCGNEDCPHYAEDVTRADLEAREESDGLRALGKRGDSDTERDAIREAGRVS